MTTAADRAAIADLRSRDPELLTLQEELILRLGAETERLQAIEQRANAVLDDPMFIAPGAVRHILYGS